MTEIEKGLKDGTLLKFEKVRGFLTDARYTSPGYIALRTWGTDEWVTHYYNASQDAFEFGHYFKDYNKALEDYNARIKEYLTERN